MGYGVETTSQKHSFICWLAMHKRLQTRERLAKLGICKETQCAICETGIETTEHLFFECDYSRTCLSEILKWLQIGVQQYKLEGLWRRMTRNSRGKAHRNITSSILAATMYHIWKARNDALWNPKVQRPQKLIETVKEECRLVMPEILGKKATSQRQKAWIHKLM
ncbi:PREDICTED: uncharacterized protein LOC109221401 [Nicotiana attenuata]|uniref:uncharacterized protein LOC109221401 n=1 Tax=Nicotiana attenuata TaxID=49451 RepID=UPI000905D126|nr:PREDICTED: uncharacterized protein LOC109221401 [Nicotiana attenuata]